MQSQNKKCHPVNIYIDIYMNSMSVSPILEHALHLLSFDSKGNNRIEEIIRIR